MSSIKTPDQKLRVFISSTINELAEERRAARETISHLTLTPVLFEMGARPYPPRDLYLAYLDQSQIFVGIYWKSYGWVAPGMEISGLEDEFRLSRNKPSLVYIKLTEEPRDPALDKLIQEIESKGTISFQKFSSAEQLSEFLLNDLAVLLSERFENQSSNQQNNIGFKSHLPIIRDQLIGRENEVTTISELLLKQAGLLTITGPGGTGKTRLALQVCKELEHKFRDGVHFVELASVTDTSLIPATIAGLIGLLDSGKQNIAETLLENLRDKQLLLVLDNFEQLLKGTKYIIDILEYCPGVSILITSRSPLHLRYEQVFPLLPLQNPESGMTFSQAETLDYPAVKLFIDRAQKINPGIPLNEENVKAISLICQKLDGLPLAIELAAARTRLFTPVQLAERMSDTLSFLNYGARDLPARQQTLYATIDWSYQLLDPRSQVFFRKLSIFNDGWTASGAQTVCQSEDLNAVLDILDQLMDFGLIHHQTKSGVPLPDPRFEMLETVKEFSAIKLQESRESEQIAAEHCAFFCDYVTSIVPKGWSNNPSSVMDQVEIDFQNITKAFNYAIQNRDDKSSWRFIGALRPLWFYRGHISEALNWIENAGITVHKVMEKANSGDINPQIGGTALLSTGVLYNYAGKYSLAKELLMASAQLLERTEDKESLAWAKLYTGLNGLSLKDFTAMSCFQEAITIGKDCDDKLCCVMAQAFYTEVMMAQGLTQEAFNEINEVEQSVKTTGSELGKAIVQFQKSNLLYYIGDFKNAGDGYETSLRTFTKASFYATMGWAYNLLGSCLTMQQRYEEAHEELLQGLSKGRESGDKEMILLALTLIAGNLAALGEKSKAVNIMRSVNYFLQFNPQYNAWSTNRKSEELVEQLFEQANITQEINEESTESISLDEAIALAYSEN